MINLKNYKFLKMFVQANFRRNSKSSNEPLSLRPKSESFCTVNIPHLIHKEFLSQLLSIHIFHIYDFLG